MYIKGTVSIELDVFDRLRDDAKDLEKLEHKVSGMIKCARITKNDDQKATSNNNNGDYNITPEALTGNIKDGSVGIIVSEKMLRELIRDFIDCEESEVHALLDQMTTEEFKKVPLILEGSSTSNCYFFTDR